MIPHNRLGADVLLRLKVYAGPEHPHQAQQPVSWTLPTAESWAAAEEAEEAAEA
jgi:large subunit ribosomal protein L13